MKEREEGLSPLSTPFPAPGADLTLTLALVDNVCPSAHETTPIRFLRSCELSGQVFHLLHNLCSVQRAWCWEDPKGGSDRRRKQLPYPWSTVHWWPQQCLWAPSTAGNVAFGKFHLLKGQEKKNKQHVLQALALALEIH